MTGLIRKMALSFFIAGLLMGCKSRTEKVLDYRLKIETSDEKIYQAFTKLVQRYNAQLGKELLSVAAPSDDSSPSVIRFSKTLRQETGDVGRGQWLKETHNSNDFAALSGTSPKQIETFGMILQFDQVFVEQRMKESPNDPSKDLLLYTLFCHETGHGVGFNHDPDKKKIMFATIDDPNKDFTTYFKDVAATTM